MPALDTERLTVRPFVMDDLDVIHRILDVELGDTDFGNEGTKARAARQQWLQWTILGYEQFAQLNQPPYGERAVVLKPTGELIGACGFVPCLNAFVQMPSFSAGVDERSARCNSTEFGLFYAFSGAHRRRGYATEAAGAMIRFAFDQLKLGRIVATTTYDNAASVGVMRRVGMRIEKNPFPEPPWLQVVGILEKDADALI